MNAKIANEISYEALNKKTGYQHVSSRIMDEHHKALADILLMEIYDSIEHYAKEAKFDCKFRIESYVFWDAWRSQKLSAGLIMSYIMEVLRHKGFEVDYYSEYAFHCGWEGLTDDLDYILGIKW